MSYLPSTPQTPNAANAYLRKCSRLRRNPFLRLEVRYPTAPSPSYLSQTVFQRLQPSESNFSQKDFRTDALSWALEISLLKSSRTKGDFGRRSSGLTLFSTSGASSSSPSYSFFFMSLFFYSFFFSSFFYFLSPPFSSDFGTCFFSGFGLSTLSTFSTFSMRGSSIPSSAKIGWNSFSQNQVFPTTLTKAGNEATWLNHLTRCANPVLAFSSKCTLNNSLMYDATAISAIEMLFPTRYVLSFKKVSSILHQSLISFTRLLQTTLVLGANPQTAPSNPIVIWSSSERQESSHDSIRAFSKELAPQRALAFLAIYLRMVKDSKMGPSGVSRTGILPSGCLARNSLLLRSLQSMTWCLRGTLRISAAMRILVVLALDSEEQSTRFMLIKEQCEFNEAVGGW